MAQLALCAALLTCQLLTAVSNFAECVGAKTDDGGLVMYSHTARKMPEATLTYKVQFSEGYCWTAGGKLPGIGSESALLLCCCSLLHATTQNGHWSCFCVAYMHSSAWTTAGRWQTTRQRLRECACCNAKSLERCVLLTLPVHLTLQVKVS